MSKGPRVWVAGAELGGDVELVAGEGQRAPPDAAAGDLLEEPSEGSCGDDAGSSGQPGPHGW